jgi:hypothetical protein
MLENPREEDGLSEESVKIITNRFHKNYSFLEVLSIDEYTQEDYYGDDYEKTCFHYTWIPYESWGKTLCLPFHPASENFKQEWL